MLQAVRLRFKNKDKQDAVIHIKGLPKTIEYSDFNEPVARFYSNADDINSAEVSRKIPLRLSNRSLWDDLPLYHEID